MAKKDKEDKKDKKERMAGDRMKPEDGSKELRGRDGKYFYNKKGELKKRTEKNNPFDVETLDDFDLSAAGSGSSRGVERLGAGELRAFRDEDRSRKELMEYAAGLDESQIGDKAQQVLAKWTDKIKRGEDPTTGEPGNPDPGTPVNPDPVTPINPDPETGEINKIINNGNDNVNVIGNGNTTYGGNNTQKIDNSFTWKDNDVTVKGSNYGNIGSVVTGSTPTADSSRFSAGGAGAGTPSAGLDFSSVPKPREENEKRLQGMEARGQYLTDKGILGMVKMFGRDAMPLHWQIPSS